MGEKFKSKYQYGKSVYNKQKSEETDLNILIDNYGMTRDAAENYLRVNRHFNEKRKISQS